MINMNKLAKEFVQMNTIEAVSMKLQGKAQRKCFKVKFINENIIKKKLTKIGVN